MKSWRPSPGSNRARIVHLDDMKKEYDFSKAERGRFHRPGAKLNLPVYLEPQLHTWLAGVARKRGEGVGTLVNRLLKKKREIVESVS